MNTDPTEVSLAHRARLENALDRHPRAKGRAVATTTWDDSPFVAETIQKDDVYQLLEVIASELMFPEDCGSLTITTTGWAAPLPESGRPEGPPSEHPDAVRVTVAVTIDAELAKTGETRSSLRFDDGRDDILDGAGQGALGDAIVRAWHQITEAGLDALGGPR